MERFVYDDQNRLIKHFHQVDSNPEELLAENTYNDLSQLVNKKVGSTSGSAPLQTIDYDYNVRGWLTDINKNQMAAADLGGKLFSYKIKYANRNGIQNPDSSQFPGKNVIPKYNGNIAEIDWRAVEVIGANPSITPKRYGYVYDGLDRLTAGFYQNPQNPYSKENTESLAYDLNGNISNLYRTSVMENGSNTATVIDNLIYDYTGNRVTKIQDLSGNSTGYEGTAGNTIGYDVNGNMKNMIDKSITSIGYNYLNLPNSLTINLGQLTTDISTKYSADGSKIRKETAKTTVGISGTTTTKETTDYLDGFQYFSTTGENTGGGGSSEMMMASRAYEPQAFTPVDFRDPGTPLTIKTPDLQFFPTAEGFYDYVKNQYIYQYKDLQGNVRVSYGKSSTGALEIVDNNDFYPFGMNHLKTGSAYFGGGSYKNHKFQGQELQETGFYGYKWRNYMPDVGRFFNIDPLSEEYSYQSHYNFSENRVIDNVELEGLEGEDFRFRMAMKQKGGIQARAEREDQEANSAAFMAVIKSVTPVEELYTLVSGRDLDGNPASRKEAGKLLALNLIPEVKAEAKAASVVIKTEAKAEAKATVKTEAKYSNLKDHKSVGPGKPFTKTQKKNILSENMKRNGGVIRSDKSGEILDLPTQSKKGVKANMNQAEIDHVKAKSKGGSNSYKNAQVLSKKENLKKLDK